MSPAARAPRGQLPELAPSLAQRRQVGVPPAVWLLTAGTFAVGTDAYVIAGVLPELSHALHVPISTAGQLVTVFAAVYALLAPLSAALTAAWPRRGVLISALALFTLGSIITATAHEYAAVLVGRIVSAAGAASFTSQASAAASSLVAPHLRARTLATVIAGLTAATVLGVPLGTLLAGILGWRATVALVGLLGAFALIGTATWLPAVPAAGRQPFRKAWSGFTHRTVVCVLAVSLLTATAEQTAYTYIGPVLSAVTTGHAGALPGLLFVLGVGAVVGNGIAGITTRRLGSRATLLLAAGGMTLDLALLPWWSRAVPVAVLAMLCFGLTGWMYVVPQQHRLLASARAAGPVGVALNNSVFYLGAAIGGAVGGGVLKLAGPPWLAVPATAFGALAVAIAALTY
jgi:MFS transporter, DHA1 family, inner membrane transport protein